MTHDEWEGHGPRVGQTLRTGNERRTVIAVAKHESDGRPLVVYAVEETMAVWLAAPSTWRSQPAKLPDLDSSCWDKRPRPGSRWRHFKGGLYGVVENAVCRQTGQHYVIYRSLADSAVYARLARSWFEFVTGPGRAPAHRFREEEGPASCLAV